MVNIVGGMARTPNPGFAIGGSVNAALANFSKALAGQGLIDDVNVNTIHPGQVQTERLTEMITDQAAAKGKTPEQVLEETIQRQGIRRLGHIEDAAELAVFLCLPRARHIQGTAISVDGGGTKGRSDLDAMTSPAPDVERWSALKVWSSRPSTRNLRATSPRSIAWGSAPTTGFSTSVAVWAPHSSTRPLTGAKTAGIDPSPSMVERATDRAKSRGALGSAESIPFEDSSFTAAIPVSTYHHWADAETGLKEVRRVLAPGGRLLIVERKLKRSSGTAWTAPAASHWRSCSRKGVQLG